MKRRLFIRKAALAVAAASVTPSIVTAGDSFGLSADGGVDDFKILSDEVRDGIRYVTATPSPKVCSRQIDIEIDVENDTIVRCAYTRGCPGNAKGLCSLLKGMKVDDVIERLAGTPCSTKGTSCPDQLARILSSLKKA